MFDKDYFLNVNQYCVLTKSQSITIPKVMRESLNLRVGDEVAISFEIKSNVIKIEKLNGNISDNKMVINRKGGILIPTEIVKLLRLKTGDTFHPYLNDQKILLRKKVSTPK